MSRDIELEALAKGLVNAKQDTHGWPTVEYLRGAQDAGKEMLAILAKPSPGTLHGELRELAFSGPDCGDNSCRFAINKVGQRTNGGCRCTVRQVTDWALRMRDALLASHPAPAPATRLCPVKHGAEHEMELVWYCETCGHMEPEEKGSNDMTHDELRATVKAVLLDIDHMDCVYTIDELTDRIMALGIGSRPVTREAVHEIAKLVAWHRNGRSEGFMVGADDLDTATRIMALFPNPGETYCAYCGARFPLDDKAAALVTEHIYTCPKHPMRDVERERDTLRAPPPAVPEGELREAVQELIGHVEDMGHDGTITSCKKCAAIRKVLAALARTPPQKPAAWKLGDVDLDAISADAQKPQGDAP